MKSPKVIGRVEKIDLPELGVFNVYAKIDTGADLSSIWASNIREEDGFLKFCLFDKNSTYYNGQEIKIPEEDYVFTRIASSFGHKELRYVVKLQVRLDKRLIRGTFTLSNRSRKTYPILIGRKILNKKFVVDVSRGTPLTALEKRKKNRMKKDLEKTNMLESEQ